MSLKKHVGLLKTDFRFVVLNQRLLNRQQFHDEVQKRNKSSGSSFTFKNINFHTKCVETYISYVYFQISFIL